MDILRNLRVKMIVSIVAVIMLVLAVLFLTLNFSLTKAENRKTVNFLSQLSQNDGHMPRPGLKDGMRDMPRAPFSMPEKNDNSQFPEKEKFDAPVPPDNQMGNRNMLPPDSFNKDKDGGRSLFSWLNMDSVGGFRNYFSVRVATNGDVLEIIRDFPLNYTDEEISEIISKMFNQKKDRGMYNGMAYSISHETATDLICVMNVQSNMAILYQVYLITGLVYGGSLFVSFLLALLFSFWSIKPVAVAFDKQKRFIADAGHELKTPIAVIGANIDVLLSDMPDNKWLLYIRDENERMSHLVKNMLFLARSDADRNVTNMNNFDFTAAVNSAVLPFESVIFEQNKKLELNAAEGLRCYGDEAQIKQCIIVLVDNAIKNSEPGAQIKVEAFQEGQKVIVTVYNTGRGIAPTDIEKIFNRFYRADSSRARQTGGYGLGLAIAKTIAEDHGGTLTAESLYGEWAKFTLTLSVNCVREKQILKK